MQRAYGGATRENVIPRPSWRLHSFRGGRSAKKIIECRIEQEERRNGGQPPGDHLLCSSAFLCDEFCLPPFLRSSCSIWLSVTSDEGTKVKENRISAIPEIWGDHLQMNPSPTVVTVRSSSLVCANNKLTSLKRERNKFRPSLPSTISAVESASVTIADG